jgi:hypothetical protein
MAVTGRPSNNEKALSSPGDAMTVSKPDSYSRVRIRANERVVAAPLPVIQLTFISLI